MKEVKGVSLNWIKQNISKWVWAYYNKGCNLLPIKYKTKAPNGLSKGDIKKWHMNDVRCAVRKKEMFTMVNVLVAMLRLVICLLTNVLQNNVFGIKQGFGNGFS